MRKEECNCCHHVIEPFKLRGSTYGGAPLCLDCLDALRERAPYQGDEVDMLENECARCHKDLRQEKTFGRSVLHGFVTVFCSECFEALGPDYQGKEKAMQYRDHTFTAEMHIILPSGKCRRFDMLASTFEHEAETEIDKILSMKCSSCGAVIEPGALYIEARLSMKVFCCLKCYNVAFPVAEGVPELKRLDSAPKAE